MKKFLALVAALGLLSTAAVAQTSAPPVFGDNLIVNPWMEIDQVNEGASTALTASSAGTFTYRSQGDGWGGTAATSASSLTTAFQNAAAFDQVGSVSDLLVTVGTGSATHADGTLLDIEQRIEPARLAPLQYGTANAQTSYLNFCAKASIAGTYSFAILQGRVQDIATNSSSYYHQFSIPTANQQSCYSFMIPGDTGGTWNFTNTANAVDATHGATLLWVLGMNGATTVKYGVGCAAADGAWSNGSGNQMCVGLNASNVAMDKTTGSTFEITGVKWSLSGSPLVHDPATELLQAQRYYAKTFLVGTGGQSGVKPAQNAGVAAAKGYASAASGATSTLTGIYWPYPTPMRAAPTITTFDPVAADAKCGDITGGSNTGTATVEPGITSNAVSLAPGVYIACASGVNATAGNRIGVGITADARL